MEIITPSFAEPNEEMRVWAKEGLEKNFFDAEVMKYPATRTLAAHTSEKVILYMPVQTTFTLESLAINPEAQKHEVAVALRELLLSLRLVAQQAGIGEIYFLGTSEETNNFAIKHGLEELPWKVFRTKTFRGMKRENLQQSSN